jgi:hypothetical protein
MIVDQYYFDGIHIILLFTAKFAKGIRKVH